MDLFEVYQAFDIEIDSGKGCYLYDTSGKEYLDLYGGHAVISIGHSHPRYIQRITSQLTKIGFYSNSVKIPVQKELADKLGSWSDLDDYRLFLCNSGAEANENALKLASFQNSKKKVIHFSGSFHGRTSLAVAATDNRAIQAPVNSTENMISLPFNDEESLEEHFDDEVSAVIVEGIQGVAGINMPTQKFMKQVRRLCNKHNSMLIMDEVQSGYGRTGKFFAYEHYDINPDLITMAKGMGNGFPIGGVLISPEFNANPGMLGSTFGGNFLACQAGLAVLEVMEEEDLLNNAHKLGEYLKKELQGVKGVAEVRGQGLMTGIELDGPAKETREKLLYDHRIFTGSSSNKNTIRLLPPLNISKNELDKFLVAFENTLNN